MRREDVPIQFNLVPVHEKRTEYSSPLAPFNSISVRSFQKANRAKSCAWMSLCMHICTAKIYIQVVKHSEMDAVCLGLDDTNRRMKTNDMSETVDRDVVILLIHLTAQLPQTHTNGSAAVISLV